MKQKKNKKKLKFKLGNNLMIWFLIIIGLVFFLQTFDLSSSNEVDYLTFEQHLIERRIESINYTQEDKVEFTLVGGGGKYWAGLRESQIDNEVLNNWEKYGVQQISIAPKPEAGIMDMIFSLAPWILILFFWFFMMRKMQTDYDLCKTNVFFSNPLHSDVLNDILIFFTDTGRRFAYLEWKHKL